MLFLLSLIGCNGCVYPIPPDYEKPMPASDDETESFDLGDYPIRDSFIKVSSKKIYNSLDSFVKQV